VRWIEWHADRLAQTIVNNTARLIVWTTRKWPLVLKHNAADAERNAYHDGFNDGWVTAIEAFAETDPTIDWLLNGGFNETFELAHDPAELQAQA